jgi:hypothetical protein
MPSVRLLLRWSGLAAVVSAVMVIAYFIAIPLLLPFLWPATRLPVAILFGMVLLLTALARDVDSYLPMDERPTARTAGRGTRPDRQRMPMAESQPPPSSSQYRQVEPVPHPDQQAGHADTQPVEATAEKSPAPSIPEPALEVERQYESLLLSMARGDKALVERLVDHERTQHPFMTRAELLQSAFERWERDNR